MAENTDADFQNKNENLNTEEFPAENEDQITQECHCCSNVNRTLLPPKLFYFFFFGANGTLMPYLVLFFKQLGLSPSQVGIVTGFKPFISFVFTPVWGYIADKTKRTKWIYILSLLAYVGGYFAYSFSPAKHVCKLRTNSTKHHQPFGMHNHMHKRSNGEFYLPRLENFHDIGVKNKRALFDHYFRRKLVNNEKYTDRKKSRNSYIPKSIDYNVYPEEMSLTLFQLPAYSRGKKKNNITKPNEDEKSKKMLTSIDNITQRAEIDINDNSLDLFEPSWGSAFQYHKSPWTVCAAAKADSAVDVNFAEDVLANVDMNSIFSYLLIVSVVSTLFSCPLITIVDTATIRKLKEKQETHNYGKQRLWGSLGWGIASFGVGSIISMIPLCPGMNNEVNYYPAFYVFAVLLLIALIIGLKLQFTASDHQHEPCPEEHVQPSRTKKIIDGLKLLKDPTYCCFIVTSFYIGIVMSIIKTFLFWHLKDIGGSQLLFSIVAAINCCAEVFVYYFSSVFIKRVGHIRVLYIALVCYSLRLFYYGLLTDPWYVLAAEPLSGITTAAAWAAMTSYVGLNATPDSVTTLQGILHGIHWGLGHGCGELIGGFMVSWIGAAMTFNIFGTLTLLQLFIFMFISWLCNRKTPQNVEEKVFEDVSMGNAKPCCE